MTSYAMTVRADFAILTTESGAFDPKTDQHIGRYAKLLCLPHAGMAFVVLGNTVQHLRALSILSADYPTDLEGVRERTNLFALLADDDNPCSVAIIGTRADGRPGGLIWESGSAPPLQMIEAGHRANPGLETRFETWSEDNARIERIHALGRECGDDPAAVLEFHREHIAAVRFNARPCSASKIASALVRAGGGMETRVLGGVESC